MTDRLTPSVTDPTADHVQHIAATSLSLLQQLYDYTVDNGIFIWPM